ncbi:MAG TPA: hypothetical protein VKA27_09935, partial [Sunxiuqinia sp.]|nr:hypothetical protein [Sunxiuqinia sp.]
IVIGFNPVVVTRTKPNKSFALSYGSLMLTFPKTENDSLIYRGSDPVGQLRFVSPPGEMPTFTFTGMPDTTLVLQPYFVDQGNDNPRTAWIRQ